MIMMISTCECNYDSSLSDVCIIFIISSHVSYWEISEKGVTRDFLREEGDLKLDGKFGGCLGFFLKIPSKLKKFSVEVGVLTTNPILIPVGIMCMILLIKSASFKYKR